MIIYALLDYLLQSQKIPLLSLSFVQYITAESAFPRWLNDWEPKNTFMQGFQLSKFVICTDAGLASNANRRFNNWGERAFITTQSIKTLKAPLKKWALSSERWKLSGSDEIYDISKLEDTPENQGKIFYKSRYIDGYDDERDIEFNQTMIVTFSLKYKKISRKYTQ